MLSEWWTFIAAIEWDWRGAAGVLVFVGVLYLVITDRRRETQRRRDDASVQGNVPSL